MMDDGTDGPARAAPVDWALELAARDRVTSGLDSIDNSGMVNVPVAAVGVNPRQLLRMSARTPRFWAIHCVTNLAAVTLVMNVGVRRGTAIFAPPPTQLVLTNGIWQGNVPASINTAAQWFNLSVNPNPNANPTHFVQAWCAPGASTPEAIELWLESIHRLLASGARFLGRR
jgi:hypothetical protein